jgi:putative ABC transport system substrate-binding protein
MGSVKASPREGRTCPVACTIPIVVAGSGDPVGVGLVAGLGRPGANITGIGVRSSEASKNLELLKGVVPALTRVGVLLGTTRQPSSHSRP